MFLLYRRRKYIYILGASLFVIGLFYSLNSLIKNDDLNEIDNNLFHGEIEVITKKFERININTYQVPAPCYNCPGENGKGVSLSKQELIGIDEIYKKEFFNLRASDKISLWRSIPDSRSFE
jgi:hypothetical protein